MTAGTEVVCNDVVHKVDIDDECDVSDPSKVGAAAVAADCNGGGSGNVGGNGKDESDDSSYVFVNGSVAGTADDTGGVDVNVIIPKSDSAHEVEQVKKEELGIEKGAASVDSLVLETNGIFHGRASVGDVEVQAVKEEVNPENGSIVDSSVVLETNDVFLETVNTQLGETSGEEGAIVTRTNEVEELNVIENIEAETDDINPGVKVDSESTLNAMECSQVTVFELSTPKTAENSKSPVTITQSGSTPDVINIVDESRSTANQVTITDSDITVNDGSEAISNLIDKAECQVKADESDSAGKPTEDVECQITADESESSGIPFDKQECQVVDGSESIGNTIDNQKCPVSVDESESTGNCTENTESRVTDLESAGKSEECQEFNEEAEPNHVCGVIKVEHHSESVSTRYPFENKKAEGTEIASVTESEENPGLVVTLSEAAGAPANAEEEKLDGIVVLGEIQISQHEADECRLSEVDAEKAKREEQVENQVEGSSESLVKNTESVELEVELEETKEE